MCNIAGYVGSKQAAPILIEMMRREEGFNGGYYTGLATIHEGKILMDKVIGDLDKLLADTDVARFPGTTGFIHSRSQSGGSVEWGHPFTGTGGKISYIANGTAGVFKQAYAEAHRQTYLSLLENGYVMRSREESPVGEYTVMPDGAGVHGSDILCQQITRYVNEGLSTMEAMEKTYCTLAGEVVGLTLNADEPDQITWGRVNFPMFAGMADHGMYLASTPHAFPEDAHNIITLSPMACGTAFADRIVTKPFSAPPGTIAPADPKTVMDCYDAVCKAIAEKEMDCEEIDELTPQFFAEATCTPYPAVEYEILYDLHKQGRLQIKTYRVPGAVPELSAPKFKMSMK